FLASLAGPLLFAGLAGAAPDSSGRICYRIDDPLVVSGSIVTSSATLGLSPPCRIDAAATRLCVSATADVVAASPSTTQPAAEPAASEAAAQRAELCYVIECPDDVAPPAGAV